MQRAQAIRASEIRRLREALTGLLDGLDDYWVTLPEGVAALEAARAALAREGGRR
jgi:hypothetical protein